MKKIILILSILTICTFAQAATSISALRDTVLTPGAEYEAGSFYRFFFGDHWRDLWTEPIKVPIIDLKNTGGGLTPFKRGGGFQTKSLHFKGNDGKFYKFRSINKDPSKLLPGYLRKTFVADIYKDQISASHPLSSIIVAPLLNTVGALNAQPAIVVLPNTPQLGEFRDDFKNVLGTFSENPKDENEESILFKGADKIIKNYDIFRKCEKTNKNQVNAVEFLKARLMDVFVGDWDRHIGQWKWARFKKNNINFWKPIPRDRDQAFSKWDGVFPAMAARAVNQIEDFDEDYPQENDITWSGRYLDRRFLAPVTKSEWDSVTNFIQMKLTNDVIKNAIKKIPEEWYKKHGENLIKTLIIRRENLKEISQDYYEMIFKYIAIYASNKDEFAKIERIDDKSVEVSIYAKDKQSGGGTGSPFFQRSFGTDETSEIRLFLLDGDDSAVITGNVDVSPLIRIIGGKGKDSLIDSSKVNGNFLYITPIADAETKTIFYDSGKKTTFGLGPSTKCVTNKGPKIKPFNEETDNYSEKYEPQVEDRGHNWKPGAWLSYNSDDGIIIGGGPSFYEYDYRANPFVYRLSLKGAYATTPQSWNLRFNSQFYELIKGVKITLDFGKTELLFTQFYGFGNESKKNKALENDNFYRVNQELLFIEPTIEYPVSTNYSISFGYLYRFSQIYLRQNTLLDLSSSTGSKDWSYMGISSNFEYNNRDNDTAPMKGFYLNFYSILFPKFFDNENTYSKTELDLRTYIKSDLVTTSSLALRFYGSKLWGTYPFFDSAFLGGAENLRGFNRERFAGNAAVFGSAEWRIYLFPFEFVVPAQFGASVFTDIGRVYYPGENSNNWHQSYGGGIWIFFVEPSYMANLSIAKSPEELAFYISMGYAF